METNALSLEELCAVIDAACAALPTDLQPDEITVNLYREKYPDLARSTCERRLAKALAAGRITRRPARYNGRRCWAYRKAS